MSVFNSDSSAADPRLDRSPGMVDGLVDCLMRVLYALGIVTLLAKLVVWLKGRRAERRFAEAAGDVQKTQAELLLSILAKQASTEFGRKYDFAGIRSVEDFRRKLPIHDYELLRPLIERQDETGEATINAEPPVFYAMTSGTTGKPKFIPVLASTLRDQKATADFFLASVLRERPRFLDGKILGIVSPAVEGRMPSGLAFGSTSGHMYKGLPRIVRQKYIVPAEVFTIEDYDLKYLVILRLAIQQRDLTYLSTANPSTIVRISKMLKTHWEALLADLEKGGFSRSRELNDEQAAALAGRLAADPARAEELRAAAAPQGARLKDVWPDLQVVTTWTGGNSAIFLEQLQDEFPEQMLLRDLGYLSSEFRGSIPITNGTNAGVPTFMSCFLEFVEQDAWDGGEQRFLGLHELENGRQYYIFVTTSYGLYRYNMNDVIRVDGSHRGVPLIKFVQKGKGVTSITGEKLYECQVIAAVQEIEKELGLESGFYLATANERTAQYTLYYSPTKGCLNSGLLDEERLAARMDETFGRINVEYRAKRDSGRIQPLRAVLLGTETFEEYKKFCLAAGLREGQFKIVLLQYQRDVKFDFEAYRIAVPAGAARPGLRRGGHRSSAVVTA